MKLNIGYVKNANINIINMYTISIHVWMTSVKKALVLSSRHSQNVNGGLVINYREEGGGYKMGKSWVQNFLSMANNFCAPPFCRGKTSLAPLPLCSHPPPCN